MDRARIKETDEIIFASDLIFKTEEFIKHTEFVCDDPKCDIKLIPCSFQEHNIRDPYFKKAKGSEHKKGCTYSTQIGLIKVGSERKLTTSELAKLKYPKQLINKKKEEKTDNDTPSKLKKKQPHTDGDFSVKYGGKKVESETLAQRVHSINRIVEFYLNFIHNRDLPIDIFGTEIEYRYLFKNIKLHLEAKKLKNKRVFYTIINQNLQLIENDEYLIIPLKASFSFPKSKQQLEDDKKEMEEFGLSQDTNEHKVFLRLKKDLNNVRQIAKIRNLYISICDSYKEYRKVQKAPTDYKPYLFFLANGKKLVEPKTQDDVYYFDSIPSMVTMKLCEVKHPPKND